MKSASRTDWKTEPLPVRHTTLSVDRRFTEAEMDHIRRGFIPEAMEDKWFIFFEGHVLSIYRSWTGYCMYVADFIETESGYAIERLRVNRDPDQYRGTDDAEDIALF